MCVALQRRRTATTTCYHSRAQLSSEVHRSGGHCWCRRGKQWSCHAVQVARALPHPSSSRLPTPVPGKLELCSRLLKVDNSIEESVMSRLFLTLAHMRMVTRQKLHNAQIAARSRCPRTCAGAFLPTLYGPSVVAHSHGVLHQLSHTSLSISRSARAKPGVSPGHSLEPHPPLTRTAATVKRFCQDCMDGQGQLLILHSVCCTVHLWPRHPHRAAAADTCIGVQRVEQVMAPRALRQALAAPRRQVIA